MIVVGLVLGLVLLLGRELVHAPLGAWTVLLGGWLTLLSPPALVGVAAARLPLTRSRIGLWLSLGVLFIAPPIFAAARAGAAAFSSPVSLMLIGVYFVGGVVVVAGAAWWVRRRGELGARRWWTAALLTPLVTLPFALMHVGEGTFTYMRVGKDWVHHQLYIFSWGVTVLVAALLVGAFVLEVRAPRARVALAAGAFVLGAGLLEADRRMFVGLHDSVHLWLEVLGVLAFFAAARFALPERPRWDLAGVVGMACCSLLLPLGPTLDIDDPARAFVAETVYGPVVLDLHDEVHGYEEDLGSQLPVSFDQHLDMKPPLDWRGYNLVLISVDTLRWDALDRMPILRSLAKDGANFTRTYATSVRTSLSMGSLLAGRTVGRVHWRLVVGSGRRLVGERRKLKPEQFEDLPRLWHTTIPEVQSGAMIAERIQAAGLRTLAVPFLGHGTFFKPGYGYELGFDVYPDLSGSKLKPPTSTKVATWALEQLDALEEDGDRQRFFQWIHLFDPHQARDPKRYKGTLLYADQGLGVYFAGLKERGLFDKTVIVVTADHGEAFGEHPQRFHATHLWDEQTRVPMVIRVPGASPLTVDHPASIIDATTTLAALAGADTTALDGVNLIPYLLGEAEYPADRAIFTELHRWRGRGGKKNRDMKAIVSWPYKLIHDRKRRTRQLFHLERDPGETTNVAKRDLEAFQRMSQKLNWYIATVEAEYPLPEY